MCLCDICGKIIYCLFSKYKIAEELNEELTCCLTNGVRPFIKRLNILRKSYEKGFFIRENNQIKVQTAKGNYVLPTINKNGMIMIRKLKEWFSEEIIKFVITYPNENYSTKFIAKCWFNGTFSHKKIDSFWNWEQAKECLEFIVKNNEFDLKEFREKFGDLNYAISKFVNEETGGKHTLLTFSRNCNIGYYVIKKAFEIAYKSAQDRRIKGTLLEQLIKDIILKYSKKGAFISTFTYKNCEFDMGVVKEDIIIDFKLDIDTKIIKEVEKYTPLVGSDKVVCVYFFGPVIELYEFGIKKISIFKWLEENKNLFINFDSVTSEIKSIINKLKDVQVDSFESYFYASRNEQIFALSQKKGYSQEQIAKKLNISRRQVGRILNGKSGSRFSNNSKIEKYHSDNEQRDLEIQKRDDLIMSLYNDKCNISFIRESLIKKGIKISISRIKEIIREFKVSEMFEKYGRSKEFFAIRIDGTKVIKFSSTNEAVKELGIKNYRTVLKCIKSTLIQHEGFLFIPVSILKKDYLEERLFECDTRIEKENLTTLVEKIIKEIAKLSKKQ
ncbi:helix-turn-helix domain-containing protein [Gottfriedia sp. NPDC057991]|uniref:helix-turn-helix domain-containing protein n=1 Tax=Gottfriedia sp. NPDC057991 TaxID=3346298 RepID=UPI0036D8C77B